MSDIVTRQRPDWHIWFMRMAHIVADRSTCISRQVGAIIVKDKQVIATGYNGAPAGVTHCTSETCLRKGVKSGTNLDLCMAAHGEQNAICSAAKNGISTDGAVMYCTTKPCLTCAKLLINAGIKIVYYMNDYNSPVVDAKLKDHLTLICMDDDFDKNKDV